MVQAEDQALISGIRAVPKGERHPLQEIDVEQAYLDWQLSLLEEPMEDAKGQVEVFWGKYEKLREEVKMQEWKLWIEALQEGREDRIPGEEKIENPQEFYQLLQNVENELENALQKWTDSCLEWYDVWREE